MIVLPRFVITGLAVFVTSLLVLFFFTPDGKGLQVLVKFIAAASAAGTLLTWLLLKLYGPARTRALYAGGVLIVVSLGIGLVAMEYTARYAFRDITTTRDNSSYFARAWYATHPTTRNRYGFREREFTTEKPKDVYRIAVIGDSLTFGQGIVENDRFSNLLERRLNQSPGGYQVLNFGRSGAETIDEVDILQRHVLGISPDFVLLQWYTNDVEGHESVEKRPQRLLPWKGLNSYLHKRSALFYLLNSQWQTVQGLLGLIDNHDAYMIKRFGDPDSPPSRAAASALEQFFQVAKAHDIPVGVVMFPPLVDAQGSVDNYRLGFLIDHAMAVCRQNDVPCLDLRPVFADVSPATTLWANRLDPHPGPLANRMASEAILKAFGDEWGQL